MISLSVDGVSYGTIEPPAGGFASKAMDLKTSAGQRWATGENFAPFDKEVTTIMTVLLYVTIFRSYKLQYVRYKIEMGLEKLYEN